MFKETAHTLHKRFIEGSLSAEAIMLSYLKRIEAHDQKIGAFLSVFKEKALEKARDLDQRRSQGKRVGRLAAVPVALKDNIHLKGEITSCASKFLTNYRAVFDATVTRLLQEEDAIILGKTNLDEFAMGSSNENSALQKTQNPWNLECVPGGSSGGSAACVASRMAPIAFGSDTGGSVRLPASFCGITGFKPSYGRVSRYGLVAYGSSLDQIGPLATSVEDIGMVMEILGRHDPHDATSIAARPEDYLSLFNTSIGAKKIGIPWHFLEDLPEETRRTFLSAIEVYKGLGCEIVDVNLDVLKYGIATYYIIATAEAATNLARFDGVRYGVRSPRAQTIEQVYDYSRTEGFGSEVKRRIFLGSFVLSAGYHDAYYKQATKVRVKIIDAFNTALETCDVIATPVSPTAAFKRGAIRNILDMYLQDVYTISANLARIPAVSIPCGFDAQGMPIGLQLMGARRQDTLVLRMAHAFEKNTEFAKAIPTLFNQEVS